MRKNTSTLILAVAGAVLLTAQVQPAPLVAQDRPGLFFREDWKEIPAETPASQKHVANPRLVLALYGPGKDAIKKSHHDKPADDPYYIWSGQCRGNWMVALRDRVSYVDLSGQAKIRLRAWQAGFHRLRPVLKLADGAWLVSDQSDGPSSDWREHEFNVADIRWRKLAVDRVVEGAWVNRPDLTRVDEVGFTDLMTGGDSNACSRLDWIEVYGKPVKRP
jgi:hypothetical protein